MPETQAQYKARILRHVAGREPLTCYAGHDLNHFAQIEAILASAGAAPQYAGPGRQRPAGPL
jgi:hypothetical protein